MARKARVEDLGEAVKPAVNGDGRGAPAGAPAPAIMHVIRAESGLTNRFEGPLTVQD
jgi:hypothetical protein